ncbi:side tail fiber protein from lambdoid prophage [Escherichia coli]|uniref:Side tail fiber protein from lambdoid prophage n=1 Tax=Escherichia coli TaxID=562 RepID=A0A376YI93_ECOLX|nr:side tail fiber protein from lambdoid prophage [Escherichia coli]
MRAKIDHYPKPRFTGNGKSGFWRITEKPERRRYSGKDTFTKNIGACRAYSAWLNIGGDSQVWTTAQFISWLESQGAFNHPYWMCKGSWAYANNKVITDTGAEIFVLQVLWWKLLALAAQ